MIRQNRRYQWPRHSLALLSAVALLAVGLGDPWATSTSAHDHEGHDRKAEISTERVRYLHIPDAPVTDQNGRQVRFLSDVVRQRPALISFIYTTCATICPLIGQKVVEVAEQLQKNSSDLAIISISVDPDYDTPARLLSWRERYGDIPQWTLLTGPKREIGQLLRAFGNYSANPEGHSDILLIGPDASGKWTRMSAFAKPDDVVAAIRAATVPAAR